MALNQAFVPLNGSQQDLKNFDCGVEGMNHFLSRFAERHMTQGISWTYVLPVNQSGFIPGKTGKAPIAAYYTMSRSQVNRSNIPQKASLPYHDVPVFLIAKLAVDYRYQQQGIGAKSLISALRHAVDIKSRPDSCGIGVVLDVLDDKAACFYKSFDFFLPMKDDCNRLYVGLKDLEDL